MVRWGEASTPYVLALILLVSLLVYSSYRFDDEHLERYHNDEEFRSKDDHPIVKFFADTTEQGTLEGLYLEVDNRTSSVEVTVTQRGTRRLDVFLYLAEPPEDYFYSIDRLVKRIREAVLDRGTIRWNVGADELGGRNLAVVFDYTDDGVVPARSETDYLDPPGAVGVTWRVQPSSLTSFWMLLASVGGLTILAVAWGGRRWVRGWDGRQEREGEQGDGEGGSAPDDEVQELLDELYIWPP